MFLYLKALHIIFVVTWFAGLFYIVRLFIYQVEALEKPDNERDILVPQLNLMAWRLWYIITWPSALITLILGGWVLYEASFHLQFDYMWVKLGFVLLLYLYHIACHVLFVKLQKGEKPLNSQQFRLWNELATLFLIAIVMLIVVKSALSFIWGIVGIFGVAVLLMILIRIYKRFRNDA